MSFENAFSAIMNQRSQLAVYPAPFPLMTGSSAGSNGGIVENVPMKRALDRVLRPSRNSEMIHQSRLLAGRGTMNHARRRSTPWVS